MKPRPFLIAWPPPHSAEQGSLQIDVWYPALMVVRLLVLLTVLMAGLACDRGNPPAAAPATAAYNDGFEVVVFDFYEGAPTNVRSLPLKQAEEAIAAGASASIPGDPTAIQQQLSAGKSGDSRVQIAVKANDRGGQVVRLSFHESNRTFVYEYAVDGNTITPLASEYRDLARSRIVQYTQ